MTPYVLDMPDQFRERVAWLESHLLGLHLGELILELKTIHADREIAVVETLEEALGSCLGDVLKNGLGAISKPQLKTLFSNPHLLQQLQERIFLAGHHYWTQPEKITPEVAARVEARWQRIQVALKARKESGEIEADVDPTNADVTPPVPAPTVARAKLSNARTWWRHPLVVSLTTAALVLVAVSPAITPRPKPVSAWGWNKPEALVSNMPAAEYLQQLASAAKEWNNKRPESRDALLERLGQFRNGCTRLILAEHKPLSVADRDWLRERCRAWSVKLDTHRQALEACSSDEVLKVRGEIDATITQLIEKLEARSRQFPSV